MSGCVQSYDAPGNVKYSQAQLEGLWCQAGGNQQDAPTASAIAMAESGGNSTATCVDSNGTCDRGLWQINSSNGNISSYDPMTNARGAVSLHAQRGWQPWTTYNSGAYLQFMSNMPAPASAPANATQAATSQPATDTSLECNAFTQLFAPSMCLGSIILGGQVQKAIDYAILQTVKIILNPFENYIAGALGMIGGGGLMIFGIFQIIMESRAAQNVTRTAGAGVAIAAGQPELAAATAPRGFARPARVGAQQVRSQRRGPVFYRPPNPQGASPPRPRDQLRGAAGEYVGNPWGAPASA